MSTILGAIHCAFWGNVSEEVEDRLKSGNAKLKPQDWKSGDKLWCIEVIAPFGGHEAMLKDLKANVFAKREISYLWNEDGKGVVKSV